MTFLYDVFFALSLVASGFGPLLYSTSLLRNDFSLSGQESALFDRNPGCSPICSPENSRHSSIVSEGLAMTTTSTTPSSPGHTNEFHSLSHLLHPSPTYEPGMETGQYKKEEDQSHAHVVRTNTQESPQSVIFSAVKTTPYIPLPTVTNAHVNKDRGLDIKSEEHPAIYSRIVLLIPVHFRSAWKFVSRHYRATFLFFVGLILVTSVWYSGAQLPLLRISPRCCGDTALQRLNDCISAWLLKRRYSKVGSKHMDSLRPGLNAITSRHDGSLYYLPSSSDYFNCKPRECNSVLEELSTNERDIYACDCYYSDVEMDSRYALSSPLETSDSADRHIDHFYRREIDLADKRGTKRDVLDASTMYVDGAWWSRTLDSTMRRMAFESEGPNSLMTHAPMNGNGEMFHSDPVDSDEVAVMSPSLEAQDHFPISPLYIPPHKRFSGLHAKKVRSWKNENLPPVLSSPEARQLPKSRQSQYDFYRDFLRSFRKRRQMPTVQFTSGRKPPVHYELNWRHKEPKTPLFENRRSPRPVELERVVGNTSLGKLKDPAVSDKLHDGNADSQTGMSRRPPRSGTHCQTAAAQRVDSIPCSQCRSRVGSNLGNRSKIPGISDSTKSAGEENKRVRLYATPIEAMPSRVLLLRDIPIVGRYSPEKGVPSDRVLVEFDKHNNDVEHRTSNRVGIEHVDDDDEF